MNISTIIRVQSNEPYIGYCIQSILDNIEDPEIIIVNDTADKETLDIIDSFTFTDITRINLDGKYTPGYALNRGVDEAKNENILVLSSHCTLTKTNMVQHVLDLHKNGYVAVFGKQVPIWRGKKISQRYIWSNFIDEKAENPFSTAEKRFFLHNAAAMYRKSVLTSYPFDGSLHTKEDRFWANKMIREEQAKILYDPQLECHHHWTPKGATWTGVG